MPNPPVRSMPIVATPRKKPQTTPAPMSRKPSASHPARARCGDLRNQPRSTTSSYIWLTARLRVVANVYFSSERRISSPESKTPSRIVDS